MSALPHVAISIRQPWAWLIVSGHKDIENRVWKTAFRGPVLIHAAKAWGPDEREVLADLIAGSNPATDGPLSFDMPEGWVPDLGGIVGVADVVDCVKASASPWFVGPNGIVLANARPLPFMPLAGALSFFRAEYAEPGTAAAPVELYRPSNGTEGDAFMSEFCHRCTRDRWNGETGTGRQCEIMGRTFIHSVGDAEYPLEWRYQDGQPTCTAFRQRASTASDRREAALASLPRDPATGRPVIR